MGNYEKINNPINESKNILDINNQICDNSRIPYHSDIIIEFDKKDDNSKSIYRCPVCLLIPYIQYNSLDTILYRCNCGIHVCSIDYFLNNFPSYPINKITFKNNSRNSKDMAFCSSCSKFIDQPLLHAKEYYDHIIRDIRDIFFHSEVGKYEEFYYIQYGGNVYSGINKNSKEKINMKKHNKSINYKKIISKFLNFNIIKKINDKYIRFQKRFKEEAGKLKKGNPYMNYEERIKGMELINEKIYLFAKYIYYIFETNYSQNNLIFQIILNLFWVIMYFKEAEKSKVAEAYLTLDEIKKYNFNIFIHCFLNNYAYDYFHKSDYEIIKEMNVHMEYEGKTVTLSKFFFDIYSKRYILFILDLFYITNKNSSNDIAIIGHNIFISKIIFIKSLEKNILAFIRENLLNIDNIFFIDLEEGKILGKISLSIRKDYSKLHFKQIEFYDDEFLFINIFDNIYLYKYLNDNNKNIIKFELMNIFKNTYRQIFLVQNMFFVINSKDKFAVAKINEEKNNFKEIFELNITYEKDYSIEIIGVKTNIILIKYYTYLSIRKVVIYNIFMRQIVSKYKYKEKVIDCKVYGGKYLLNISNEILKIFDLKLFKKVADIKVKQEISHKNWDVYKDNSRDWYIYFYQNIYKIEKPKMKYIKNRKFYNQSLYPSEEYTIIN